MCPKYPEIILAEADCSVVDIVLLHDLHVSTARTGYSKIGMRNITMEESPHEDILNTSLSSNGKKIVRKYFNWAIISYMIMSFMAAILSLGAASVALFLIVQSFLDGVDHPVWADITMSLLLGVWVSGKPKFFSRKKVEKK